MASRSAPGALTPATLRGAAPCLVQIFVHKLTPLDDDIASVVVHRKSFERVFPTTTIPKTRNRERAAAAVYPNATERITRLGQRCASFMSPLLSSPLLSSPLLLLSFAVDSSRACTNHSSPLSLSLSDGRPRSLEEPRPSLSLESFAARSAYFEVQWTHTSKFNEKPRALLFW